MRMPGADLKKVKESKWHEYVIRFVFGGLVTAGAGWVAQEYGPSVGGLFLAFPAIFPASITMVQQHEDRKHSRGGNEKGKQKAGMSAAGALAGSVGMLAFGAVVWGLAGRTSPWICLPVAFAAWLVASLVAWVAQQQLWPSVDRVQEEGRASVGPSSGPSRATWIKGS